MKSYMQTAEALGTTIELRLVSESAPEAKKWLDILWDEIAKFEGRFSRFLKSSELSSFNKNAGKKTTISPEFKEWLVTLPELARVSNGLFNPFILPLLHKNGYRQSINSTHSTAEDYSERIIVGIEKLEIGANWAKIPENTAIDSGGSGKGYLADMLASQVRAVFRGFSLSIGGDMALNGIDEAGVWNIGIHPLDEDLLISYKNYESLNNFSIATSGLSREKRNHSLNHIINPKSGEIVNGDIETCTVVANSTVVADVLASAVLIGGEELARILLDQGNILGILLQTKNSGIITMGQGFEIKQSSKKELEYA